jgi:hypothetical protein
VAVQLPLRAVGAGMIPMAPQAARTLPSSAAMAKTRRRNRYPRVIMQNGDASFLLDLAVKAKGCVAVLRSWGCAPVSLHPGDRTG